MKQLDKQPVLETERMRLRPLQEKDAERIQEYCGDLRIAEMTARIPHPYPEGAAAEWIELLQNRKTNEIVYGLTRRNEDELLGVIGIHPTQDGYAAEIGFWIGVPHWGEGYCTEAAAEVLRFCFEDLELLRVFAGHFAGNEASGRVQQKVGMINEGTERWGIFRFGEPKDRVLYGIIRPEWEKLKRS